MQLWLNSSVSPTQPLPTLLQFQDTPVMVTNSPRVIRLCKIGHVILDITRTSYHTMFQTTTPEGKGYDLFCQAQVQITAFHH